MIISSMKLVAVKFCCKRIPTTCPPIRVVACSFLRLSGIRWRTAREIYLRRHCSQEIGCLVHEIELAMS